MPENKEMLFKKLGGDCSQLERKPLGYKDYTSFIVAGTKLILSQHLHEQAIAGYATLHLITAFLAPLAAHPPRAEVFVSTVSARFTGLNYGDFRGFLISSLSDLCLGSHEAKIKVSAGLLLLEILGEESAS